MDALAAFGAEMAALDKKIAKIESQPPKTSKVLQVPDNASSSTTTSSSSSSSSGKIALKPSLKPRLARTAVMKPRKAAVQTKGGVHARVAASSAPVMYSSTPGENGKRKAVGPVVQAAATVGKRSKLSQQPQASSSSSSSSVGFQSNGAIGPSGPPPKEAAVTLRTAAGKVWEDKTLSEWPQGYRLFCGDIGPEVNDKMLGDCFKKYQSFQMARVIRDTRTTRVRGYGFVSFGEALDCVRAMRDENGKYCGTRPLNLQRSKHQQRSIQVSKKEAKRLLQRKQRAQFQ